MSYTVKSTIDGAAYKIVIEWGRDIGASPIHTDEIVIAPTKGHPAPTITINGATVVGARAARNLQWLEGAMLEAAKYQAEASAEHFLEHFQASIKQHFELAKTAGQQDHSFDVEADASFVDFHKRQPSEKDVCIAHRGQHRWRWEAETPHEVYCLECGQTREAFCTVGRYLHD